MWSNPPAFAFSHRLDNGHTAIHDVYVKGSGPPILILQELPGIGPDTYALADRLIAAGFTVYLPHLLGRLGRANRLTALANAVGLFCVRREFNMFLTGEQSPIAAWMRALCAEISDREAGAKLGVIGMCLTGSFAIPLMAEPSVHGAVASQPALPIRNHQLLHMSAQDVANANAAMTEKGCALALRFQSDRVSRPAHIKALKDAFAENLRSEELTNPAGQSGSAHSVLTLDFSDVGYAIVEDYFGARFGL